VACCAVYAGSDELHQLFVSSRQASVVDVMIDTCGASAGLLALRGIKLRRNHWDLNTAAEVNA
jgi:VanZ family protein